MACFLAAIRVGIAPCHMNPSFGSSPPPEADCPWCTDAHCLCPCLVHPHGSISHWYCWSVPGYVTGLVQISFWSYWNTYTLKKINLYCNAWTSHQTEKLCWYRPCKLLGVILQKVLGKKDHRRCPKGVRHRKMVNHCKKVTVVFPFLPALPCRATSSALEAPGAVVVCGSSTFPCQWIFLSWRWFPTLTHNWFKKWDSSNSETLFENLKCYHERGSDIVVISEGQNSSLGCNPCPGEQIPAV